MKRFTSIILLVALLLSLPMIQAYASSATFTDVSPTSWYSAPVTYAASSGFAVGSGNHFYPKAAVTRGEFVTMLARVVLPEGIPDDLPDTQFSDVEQSRFYYKPVMWAVANGIADGTSAGEFSPQEQIKRQDMALMILRTEQRTSLGILPAETVASAFADDQSISGYARTAVYKLQEQGLLTGNKDGSFNPKSSLTRAEAVTVLSHLSMYKTGHTHTLQAAETVAPTCATRGKQFYRCQCGSYYAVYTNAALGHNYVLQKTDAASWTATYQCSRCGTTYTEKLPGEAPHKIYDGNSLISYENALAVVDQLQQIYPDLLHSYVGGYSVWGTGIRVVTLGKGNRYIFMNGNIHAKETVTTNYLLKVLDEYAYAYSTNGKIGAYQIKPLLDTFTLVIIPCSNPDGRAKVIAGNNGWKANGRGVNLNENFPTNWVYASSGGYGAYAGSEPETQTIISVLNRYPFELVLDCHTSGEVIYYADNDCSAALSAKSYNLAKALKAKCGFGLYKYGATAGMANYARHPYGVPGFTIEMFPYVASGPIDCTKFSSWVWSKLDTIPAIAMNYLK